MKKILKTVQCCAKRDEEEEEEEKTSLKEAGLMGTRTDVISETGLGKKPRFLLWHSVSCALKGSVCREPGWAIQEAECNGPQSPKDQLLTVGRGYWALIYC